jgi:diaminopimelate decarboxylase
MTSQAQSPASVLSEFMSIDPAGHLRVESVDVHDLAEEYGTPLYVTSENQIRHNFRRFHAAFSERYPDVTVLFANKANSNLAVRRILAQEGAGGDCFGLGELMLSLMAGVSPEKLAMNGSNKTVQELTAAIENGVVINLDHPDELDTVIGIANRLGVTARVNIRILPFSYADPANLTEEQAAIARDRSHDKWGVDKVTAREVARTALNASNVDLEGLHCHISRLRPTAEGFELAAGLMVDAIADLNNELGWQPQVLDIGGGYAHERDPESGLPPGDHPVSTPEEYAEAIITPLRSKLAEYGLNEPHLHLEPGRHLVSNASVLLGRVGIIKSLPSADVTWVNLDASTNHCLRTLIAGYRYHIINASRANDPEQMVADVIGPNCTKDLIGASRSLPQTSTGDLLAVLDVGGYAEMTANQFNSIPRPATVLVNGDQVDVIRRRETFQDLILTQQVPTRLLS